MDFATLKSLAPFGIGLLFLIMVQLIFGGIGITAVAAIFLLLIIAKAAVALIKWWARQKPPAATENHPAPATHILADVPISAAGLTGPGNRTVRRADPTGLAALWPVVSHDLYGTKDVQDAITASYVWMADQIGHITLGLVPTMILAWLWKGTWRSVCEATGRGPDCGIHYQVGGQDWLYLAGYIFFGLGILAYWVTKELDDFADSQKKANAPGNQFPFDDRDLARNVYTALLYFATGGVFAVAAFNGICVLAIALVAMAAIDLPVAYWWLRRKLAFQQAGLPYLYRLANFSGKLQASGLNADAIGPMTLRGAEPPAPAHIVISGSIGSGRTSLATGIGTEFAFRLGIARYLSLVDLIELAPQATAPGPTLDYDDGRVLWPLDAIELLIVDDVDAAPPGAGATRQLATPTQMQVALGGPGSLAWLRGRRSVWVVGTTTDGVEWQKAIANLIGIGLAEIGHADLAPPKTAPR